ncbi:hypothetical protein [Pantoea dispersa]|uniref:Uncharacterized protein n=1 Tax=Pantoea dispersa TaxID=59814 RepID=A0A8E1RYL4_9GAMM|nr:hypothetical protein [Pantoea dispersa]KTR89523.1 hypothetical protein SA2_14720 [Pantoea dispersa]KTS21672.1 hypothetical protein SA4R_13865 [Pantoea dispersa]KTS64094.1 hypothetical protein SA5R_01520 [Pantoea dispersa]KTS67697.1 hypothetical protein SA3R_10175 [Pantoea dispersa]
MNILPNREMLKEVIQQLNAGVISRSQVSEWAFSIIDDEEIRVKDQIVGKTLECLGAVDIPSTDRDYLYGTDDFIDWLKSLDE